MDVSSFPEIFGDAPLTLTGTACTGRTPEMENPEFIESYMISSIPGRRLSQPVLISLAPLTNIALALSLEPRLPQLCPETGPQDELKVMIH